MKQFHPLQVVARTAETADSVRIALAVPDDLKDEYDFMPGQHLPIELLQDGKRLRRTYSICSAAGEWPLQIGVRVQPGGKFSAYVADELAVGDTLQAMPPTGRFHANLDAANEKSYLCVAAGSGITPVLSIIASILQTEPRSRCVLFYGNRKQSTTMFVEDLYALKNRFMQRLQLHFVFSQEDQELSVAAGRLDADKVRELVGQLCAGATIDEAFVCGPDTMIESTQRALLDCGLSEQQVHSERFGAARRGTTVPAQETVAEAGQSSVTVIMDGHKKTFVMSRNGASIVDAAATHGIELPYSCKGGVCATCRTHLREGAVDMAYNYGLEPWEVEQGFVLACQSQPRSDKLTLDYDKS